MITERYPQDFFTIGQHVVMLLILLLLGPAIVGSVLAVVNERRMQRHRQPGVGYWQVTLRRDGGWRGGDLFTETGLAYQRRAAKWGLIGTGCLASAVVLWVILLRVPF